MYDVEAIRGAHPIEDVIAAAGVELRRAGRRLVGSCPFHDDRRPSLTVYPGRRSYFCFSCGAGGDVIDFIERFHAVGFKEAAAMLTGRQPSRGNCRAIALRQPAERTTPTPSEAEVIDAAAALYAAQLWRSRLALHYLRERGVDELTARATRLGYAAGGLAGHLRGRGLSLPAARRVGLLAGDRDLMAGRIIIPDIQDGQATWLVGRSIDGRGPRYLNLRLSAPLLGSGWLREDEAILVEGPFDWLALVGWGLPALALMGTHASLRALKGLHRFRRVYVALDADDAGRAAATRLAYELGERVAVVELPAGVHDPGDLARRPGGRDEFLRCLERAAERIGWIWSTPATMTARAA